MIRRMATDDTSSDEVIIEEHDENEEVTNEGPGPADCSSQGESAESNSTCMICMEEWTLGSEHRICCLKCGHLFGRSCIERWMIEKKSSAKCPTCNKPTRKADIRDLWCKAIKASDDSELCQLRQALERERNLRKQDSAVIFHYNRKSEILLEDLDNLKRAVIERDKKIQKLESILNKFNKIRQLKMSNETNEQILAELETLEPQYAEVAIDMDIQPRELKGRFHFAEKVESNSSIPCKCFSLCPTSSRILVAQSAPSGAPTGQSMLFGSHGIRKYSTLDLTVREFIPLHTKPITSIQLKPLGDLILTASLDKKVRLTSITNNTCVLSYECLNDPSSVAWSAHRDQQFYVGSSNCFVSLYDMRNTSQYIYQTSQKVAGTKLISVASTTGQDTLEGLIVNDIKGSQFLEISESSNYETENIDQSVEHMTRYELPYFGNMGTVDFHKPTQLSLITTRKTQTVPNTTHDLVKLKKTTNEEGTQRVECERIRTFFNRGSAELLSQSRILKHPTLDDQVLVASWDATTMGVKLWDASDNTEFQSIRTDIFIRDILMYTPENSNQHVLYLLSDKGINVYRWDFA